MESSTELLSIGQRDCKFVEQAEEPPSYYTGEEVENFPDNSGKPPPYKITAKKQSVSSVNPPPYEFSLNEESDSERAPLSRPPRPPVHSEPECPPVIPSTMFFAPVVYPFPLPVSSYDSRTTEEREADMEEREIKSAPFLIVISSILFLCGGFLPLYFYRKAYLAEKQGKKSQARKLKLKGARVAGLPFCITMVLCIAITIVIVVTVENV